MCFRFYETVIQFFPENNALKAVIFDLDGTLLDTLDDLADAGNRVLAAAGLPTHPVDRYRYFVGDGVRVLAERILPVNLRDDENIERLMSAFREDYGRNWHVKTRMYDGIGTMLTSLQQRKVSLNILSNKPHDFTQQCVRKFMGQWHFSTVLGHRPGTAWKPDPAAALEIAAGIGIPPAEILYLGDTATDMKTARAAGMYAVGALWGFRTAAELEDNGAVRLVRHPMELPQLIQAAG